MWNAYFTTDEFVGHASIDLSVLQLDHGAVLLSGLRWFQLDEGGEVQLGLLFVDDDEAAEARADATRGGGVRVGFGDNADEEEEARERTEAGAHLWSDNPVLLPLLLRLTQRAGARASALSWRGSASARMSRAKEKRRTRGSAPCFALSERPLQGQEEGERRASALSCAAPS